MCPKKYPTSGPVPTETMILNSNSSKQAKICFSLLTLLMTLEDSGVIFRVGVKKKEEKESKTSLALGGRLVLS